MKISTTIFFVAIAGLVVYAIIALSAQKLISNNPEILKLALL